MNELQALLPDLAALGDQLVAYAQGALDSAPALIESHAQYLLLRTTRSVWVASALVLITSGLITLLVLGHGVDELSEELLVAGLGLGGTASSIWLIYLLLDVVPKIQSNPIFWAIKDLL